MTQQKNSEPAKTTQKDATKPEEPVRINGFQQVLEMLKVADPAFRESLLKRLAARDIELANHLRRDLDRLEL